MDREKSQENDMSPPLALFRPDETTGNAYSEHSKRPGKKKTSSKSVSIGPNNKKLPTNCDTDTTHKAESSVSHDKLAHTLHARYGRWMPVYTVTPAHEPIQLEPDPSTATRTEAYLSGNMLSLKACGVPWDMPDMMLAKFTGGIDGEAAPIRECHRITRQLWQHVTAQVLDAEAAYHRDEIPEATYRQMVDRFMFAKAIVESGKVSIVIESCETDG